jgi:hypothetical protein
VPRARRLLVVALGATVFLLPAGATGHPSIPGDPTPPVVTPHISGTLGANGWYVSNVTVDLRDVVDPESIILETRGCDVTPVVADTIQRDFSCYARSDGGETTVTVHIHRDATAPTVTVVPSRGPDANGWYNHPLTVGFSGSDVTSGVEACSQATYGGPDNANASAAGTCRDRAGNVASAAFGLKYDATPPTLGALRVKAGNQKAQLYWNVQDASSVALVRTPGLKGATESVVFSGPASALGYTDRGLRPGRQYQYRLTAADQAANQAMKTLQFLARGALLYPAPGEHVAKPPLLVWTAKRGASYYNVILVRGRRVFSAWPVQARLKLPRAWKYRGRRYKLRPGTYSWFVWPGHGPLSAGRYGKLLGGSTFTFGGSG